MQPSASKAHYVDACFEGGLTRNMASRSKSVRSCGQGHQNFLDSFIQVHAFESVASANIGSCSLCVVQSFQLTFSLILCARRTSGVRWRSLVLSGTGYGDYIVKSIPCITLFRVDLNSYKPAMNPYEKAREERIKRNNAMLAQLEVCT